MTRTKAVNPNADERILVSYKHAGVLLDVAAGTIGKMARSGELPRVRVGGAVRIPVAALRALAQPDR